MNRIPDQWKGHVMVATYGGLNAAYVVNTAIPALLADISGAHGWAYVDLDLHDFDIAERYVVEDVTDELRQLGTDGDLGHLLDPVTGQLVRRILVVARPRGEAILPAKPTRDGVARFTMARLSLRGAAWCWWLEDVFSGMDLGGSFPRDIVQAIEFFADSELPNLSPVRLPTGRVVDPRTECLVAALTEERKRLESDPSSPEGLVRLTKRLAIVLASGNRGRIDRESVRKAVTDRGIFLDEVVTHLTKHPERPGPDFDPLIYGSVTARVRRAVCQAIGGFRAHDSRVLHVATDSVIGPVTFGDEPEFLAVRGGPIRSGRRRGLTALPLLTIQELLTRTGAPWKLVDGHEHRTLAVVAGTQKYSMVPE